MPWVMSHYLPPSLPPLFMVSTHVNANDLQQWLLCQTGIGDMDEGRKKKLLQYLFLLLWLTCYLIIFFRPWMVFLVLYSLISLSLSLPSKTLIHKKALLQVPTYLFTQNSRKHWRCQRQRTHIQKSSKTKWRQRDNWQQKQTIKH